MQKSFQNTGGDIKHKILFIEDEVLIRELYADALQHLGIDFVLAENGEEGLLKWQQNEFSLLITDIGLPGISGWDVIESIRKVDKTVPIIVITGWTDKSEFSRGKNLNVNHVLSKPIDILSLTTIIKDALQPTSRNIPFGN